MAYTKTIKSKTKQTKSKRFTRKNNIKSLKKHIVHSSKKEFLQPSKKGVSYTVEPLSVSTRDPTIQGDIYKKFINGKLVKQKFISKNKLKDLLYTFSKRKIGKYVKFGGETKPVEQPVIKVADETSFWQSLKTGFAFGLAFEFANQIIEEIFE